MRPLSAETNTLPGGLARPLLRAERADGPLLLVDQIGVCCDNRRVAAARFEAEWERSIASLRSLDRVPAALANADLLSDARPQWSDRLVARTSMHDLWFTRPEDVYPFPVFVKVSTAHGVFEFQLLEDWRLVTADRATRRNALDVLNAFLLQLDTGSAPGH